MAYRSDDGTVTIKLAQMLAFQLNPASLFDRDIIDMDGGCCEVARLTDSLIHTVVPHAGDIALSWQPSVTSVQRCMDAALREAVDVREPLTILLTRAAVVVVAVAGSFAPTAFAAPYGGGAIGVENMAPD